MSQRNQSSEEGWHTCEFLSSLATGTSKMSKLYIAFHTILCSFAHLWLSFSKQRTHWLQSTVEKSLTIYKWFTQPILKESDPSCYFSFMPSEWTYTISKRFSHVGGKKVLIYLNYHELQLFFHSVNKKYLIFSTLQKSVELLNILSFDVIDQH